MENILWIVVIHAFCASLAILIGPVALWARLGKIIRPKIHRAFGYAWVTLMIISAATAIFIRDFSIPNVWGYTPIHILVPITFWSLISSFRHLANGNIQKHRQRMILLYVSACIVAGIFTLLPTRMIGSWLWTTLGWM